tara:strand:+ start:335 stop:613 length:279 start_codon:yes stop_codon:yes gene_type:complete
MADTPFAKAEASTSQLWRSRLRLVIWRIPIELTSIVPGRLTDVTAARSATERPFIFKVIEQSCPSTTAALCIVDHLSHGDLTILGPVLPLAS